MKDPKLEEMEMKVMILLRQIKQMDPTINTTKYGHKTENTYKNVILESIINNTSWNFEVKRSGDKTYLNLVNDSKGALPKIEVYIKTGSVGRALPVKNLEIVKNSNAPEMFVRRDASSEMVLPVDLCLEIIGNIDDEERNQ